MAMYSLSDYCGRSSQHGCPRVNQKDEHWLLTQIQEQGFQRLQEIYLGEYLSGQLSLSPYEEKTIS